MLLASRIKQINRNEMKKNGFPLIKSQKSRQSVSMTARKNLKKIKSKSFLLF